MKRLIIILLTLISTVPDIMAETFSATLSINSLTVESPANLVKPDEILELNCVFTANVSLAQLPNLEQTLNTELYNAGIRSLEIVNVHKHPTSAYLLLTLRFGSMKFENTRIFKIQTASGEVTITLICDSDGILDGFTLEGDWLSDTSDDFTLELSGSQQAVTYKLIKDGITKKTMTGTGNSLDFGQFSGMSSHGTYQVVAQYKDWDEQIVGTTRMVRKDDIGGKNYTAVKTYVNDGGDIYYTDVTYYNGLGYPDQEISINATTDNMNVVRPIVYDNMLRSDAKSYVPYCSTEDTGMYVQDATEEQRRFYTMMDKAPFHEKTFENGITGRTLTSQRPGKIYRDNDKKEEITYGINNGNEGIIEFGYNYATSGVPACITKIGNFTAGKLKYIMTTSENNDVSYVFSDVFDKTILQRKISDGVNHDTYFIYDLKDSLVCVIQPEGSATVPDSFEFSDQFCKNFCFTYTYDARGNIIEKTLPSAGKVVMVYDQRNRLVLSADEQMLAIGKYKYIVYNSMDMVTQEGYSSLNKSLEDVRTDMSNQTNVLSCIKNLLVTRTVAYYTNTSVQTPLINSNSKAYLEGINYNYCLNLPLYEMIYSEPYFNGNNIQRDNSFKMKKYFYDKYGRLTLMTESSSDGWTSVYSWQNDFVGNILQYTEEHYDASHFDSMVVRYTYDNRGRRRTMTRNLNGIDFATVSYDYDAFGRMRVKNVENRGSEVYGYNIQGWTESSSACFYGYDIFSQRMNYQFPVLDSSEPRYDGMISEIRYRHLNKDIQTVCYHYDGIHRLSASERFVNWDSTACNLWNEKDIQYDLNGNIRYILRQTSAGNEEEYWLDYIGNRLMWSGITGGAEHQYDYYENGNLKIDLSRNLQFHYNLLNLPTVVSGINGQTSRARYLYYADGNKYSVSDANGNGYRYRGSFVYNISSTGEETLESVGYDEGRLIATYPSSTTTQFIDTWHVKDYLGNVRVVLDITNDTSAVSRPSLAIIEQNDYLPFGTRVESANMAYDLDNRYRYNGKEEQVIGELDLIDYGARFYDNTFTRWTTPDPMAEKYFSISPYAFCNNNPVNFVDLDGKAIDFIWDIASVGMGIQSFVQNVQSGNVRGAVGDGVGVVIDAVAAAMPFIPGGVGYIRQGARLVNLMDAEGDFLRLTGELQSFDKASEFGVDSYKTLKKSVKSTYGTGSGLEVHHLIEKRFAKHLGMKETDIPSIVLTKDEHQKFTNVWRKTIGYEKSGRMITTSTATRDKILEEARNIYKDYPELFKTLEEVFK